MVAKKANEDFGGDGAVSTPDGDAGERHAADDFDSAAADFFAALPDAVAPLALADIADATPMPMEATAATLYARCCALPNADDADAMDSVETKLELETESETETELETEIESETLAMPHHARVAECVHPSVRYQYRLSSRVLMTVVFDHLGLEAHIDAATRMLCGGTGDFAQALTEGVLAAASAASAAAYAAWNTAPGSFPRHVPPSAATCCSILEDAIRDSSAALDPLSRLVALTPNDDDGGGTFSEHDIRMMRSVAVSYAFPWPLSLVAPVDATASVLTDVLRVVVATKQAAAAIHEVTDDDDNHHPCSTRDASCD